MQNKQEATKDTVKTEIQKQTFFNMNSNPKKVILIKKNAKCSTGSKIKTLPGSMEKKVTQDLDILDTVKE